ncbi:MAG: lytic murein transglycosylase [Pseudomonadota bacterium]
MATEHHQTDSNPAFGRTRRTKTSFALTLLVGFLSPLLTLNPAKADAGFERWKSDFAKTAVQKGIKRSTFRAAFSGVDSIDPAVIKSVRYQPEFLNPLWFYFDSRVNERTTANGKKMKQKWSQWLDVIEKRYGVDRHVVLAIWSMETGYGSALSRPGARRSVIRSLATLAYRDKKRRKLWRAQLIAAMKIVQDGTLPLKDLVGSWSGAMGHTQFIPTSYLAYKQDADGDGRSDIWTNIPDALATAANHLKVAGWQPGKTWGYEVIIPAGLAKQNRKARTLREWSRLGVRRANGTPFPRPDDRATLRLLGGKGGPVFLMLKNFFVIKKYNNADKYALAVGHQADLLAGGGEFIVPIPRPFKRLSLEEHVEIQSLLTRMGLYNGPVSGIIGPKTRSSIGKAQAKFGMKQDGFASKKLLDRLRRSG